MLYHTHEYIKGDKYIIRFYIILLQYFPFKRSLPCLFGNAKKILLRVHSKQVTFKKTL